MLTSGSLDNPEEAVCHLGPGGLGGGYWGKGSPVKADCHWEYELKQPLSLAVFNAGQSEASGV